MQHTTKKQARQKGAAIAHKHDTRQLAAFLAQEGQLLLPMVELIEQSKVAVQDLLATFSRAAIEALLTVSAEQVAGPKRQGQRGHQHEPIGWHGTQPGQVTLADRRLRVRKPRLRRRALSKGGEVEIPAYTALQNDQPLGKRMLDIVLAGVSTRQYEQVLPEMAGTVGISKSSVSREVLTASVEELRQLNERRFDEVDLLVIYIDGMVCGEHHVIGAIGVDCDGRKHVLGVTLGATENATVVTGLLSSFVERGITPERRRLFVIDGSKALRAAIRTVYGEAHPVQRCRAHKLRNVRDHLPETLQEQVQAAMQAAYKLPWQEGMARLRKQAEWLASEHPAAAASLLEGLEETFTINRLGLPPTLRRSLATTNVIENSHRSVRRCTQRVSKWEDGHMVLRWAAAAFLTAEQRFCKIMGYRDLWMLAAALQPELLEEKLDAGGKAA